MDHDHVGPRLQDLERGRLGRRAYQALHQASEPLLLGVGLLEQRWVRPPLLARLEIVERDDRSPRPRGPPVDEQRAALWQHAARDDLPQARSPRIEDGRAGHRVEDQQQARPRRFHEERPLDYADAVGRQPAELGLLPRDHAALDVHARERLVGRDEERTRGSDLLPADVPLQLERPRGGRARGGGGAGGYSGLSVGRRVERDDQRERQKWATSGHGDPDVPPVGPYIPPARAGAQERGGFNRRKRAGPLSEVLGLGPWKRRTPSPPPA